MKQIPLSLGPTRSLGFADLLVGRNAQAIEHLSALSADPARSAHMTPVTYLWGASGTGKTHLLTAVGHAVQQGGGQALWLSDAPAEHYLDDAATACSVLIMDNCDALSPERQQMAFAAFVRAAALGLPVVAAGRRPPTDLPLRDDVRSRLGWGLIFELHPLNDAECMQVLRDEARRRGLALSPEVESYLMTRFQRDLKSLMNLLDRLDYFSLVQKRAVTVPLLKTMLSEEAA